MATGIISTQSPVECHLQARRKGVKEEKRCQEPLSCLFVFSVAAKQGRDAHHVSARDVNS